MNQEASTPLLYSFRRCPYAMRARWSLLISEQVCIIREILLKAKPAHMLELSPKGTVPVLLLPDETVLEESLDIMHWALGKRDLEHWLEPQEGSASDMQALIHRNDHDFKKHLDRYKYPHRYENIDQVSQRTEAEKFIQSLEERLTKNQFLFGNRRCFADIAIVPFIRQFINTDKQWFETSSYTAVRSWANQLLGGTDFETVMTKYPLYEPDKKVERFPSS